MQARLGLAQICALQGDVSGAVKQYALVGEKHPARAWEVLQAWKGAGDLLWEAHQPSEAKRYYAKIVERYDVPDASVIAQTAVRGAQARLAER